VEKKKEGEGDTGKKAKKEVIEKRGRFTWKTKKRNKSSLFLYQKKRERKGCKKKGEVGVNEQLKRRRGLSCKGWGLRGVFLLEKQKKKEKRMGATVQEKRGDIASGEGREGRINESFKNKG